MELGIKVISRQTVILRESCTNLSIAADKGMTHILDWVKNGNRMPGRLFGKHHTRESRSFKWDLKEYIFQNSSFSSIKLNLISEF